MEQLFIQMSGAPGSGKTTVANAIATQIGAVIIDHDITKSALLDADVSLSVSGKASYQVLDAVARHLLSQGHHVIFDSPCFYVELLQRGQRLVQEANARYLYIECVLENLVQLDRRLRQRHRHRSQVAGIQRTPTGGSRMEQFVDAAVFRDWIANMKRPETGYLVLDTAYPLEACLEKAMAYIESGENYGQTNSS